MEMEKIMLRIITVLAVVIMAILMAGTLSGCTSLFNAMFGSEENSTSQQSTSFSWCSNQNQTPTSFATTTKITEPLITDQGEKKPFGYVYDDLKEASQVAEDNSATLAVVICPTGCSHCYGMKSKCLMRQSTLTWAEKNKIVLCYYVNNTYCSNFYKSYGGAWQSYLGTGITPYLAVGTVENGVFNVKKKTVNGKEMYCAVAPWTSAFGVKEVSESDWNPQYFIDLITAMAN